MPSVKCVIVGDRESLKTELLIVYVTKVFPTEYVPTVFDGYSANVIIGGEPSILSLIDTASRDDYDRLRPLAYPHTDVFLVCYSVVSPSSFERVSEKWVPEIRHHCSKAPILLVATDTDLRDDGATLEKLAINKQEPIRCGQGEILAEKLGAVRYLECSPRTKEGVDNVFDEAIVAAIENKKRKCVIL